MFIVTKAIQRFNEISIKCPGHFSQTRINHPKIYTEPQKSQNTQRNVEKKNKTGGSHSLTSDYTSKL